VPLFRTSGAYLVIFFIKCYLYIIIHILKSLLLIFDGQFFVRQVCYHLVQAGLDVAEVYGGGLVRFYSALAFFLHRILFEVKLVFCF